MVRKGGLALDRVFGLGWKVTISPERDPAEANNPHESLGGPPYCPHDLRWEGSAIAHCQSITSIRVPRPGAFASGRSQVTTVASSASARATYMAS